MLTEQDYFSWLQSGNQRGFKYFFDCYYQPLCYYACNIIKDRVEAEDIVSHAFFKLWQKRRQMAKPAVIKPFLYITVRNLCLNFLKSKKRKLVSMKKLPAVLPEYTNWLNNELLAEAMEILYKAIERLPARQRKVIYSILQGLSNQEIANEMGIKEQTVRSQRHKSIQWMKELLNQHLRGKG